MDSLPQFKPHDYQQIGTQFMIDHPRCMIIADPGLGKTGMTLSLLGALKLVGSNFLPALVLAPKRVADVVWTNEAKRWSTFKDLSVVQITGTEKQRLEILRAPQSDVYVCNYELVEWLVNLWPQDKWPYKIVVADECSRLKGFRLNKGTKRSTALAQISQFTGRWINLTGTPAPNGLNDLWGQYYFLDKGERLKRSYTAFMEAYFIENQWTHRITMQHGAEAAIHEAVKDITLAFRAEDWLDVTKPQLLPVEFEMPPAAKAQYKRMEKEFFMEVDDAQIEAGTAAIKSSKLLQICAGSVIDTETSVTHAVHDGRLEALDDVLDQIEPEPLLVSYWWKSDPPRILEHLKKRKIPARLYQGKQDEIDWNARKFRVLLLQEQSAFGLNLHEPCRDILHYSYIWNAELWTQMIERVGPARQAQAGKKAAVRVWYAIAKGTVDQDVIDSNFRKITVEQALKRARARSRQ
jgi:SNF2 family DNA or RNA helicase